MANLEQLTEQILADARARAAEIIQEAQGQANRQVSSAMKETQGKRDMALSRARNEADLLAERIVSGTSLKIRDEKLKAKGKVIDQVMKMVRDRLSSLSPQETLQYLKTSLKDRRFAPEETLLVREGLQDEVKQFLGHVNVQGRPDLSGYIIDKNGVLENHSFETTLDYLKEDLEAQAAEILFRE